MTENIPSRNAGLQSDSSISCVACKGSTGTVLGFEGPAQWVALALIELINGHDRDPHQRASDLIGGKSPGCVPSEERDAPEGGVSMVVTVCQTCVAHARARNQDCRDWSDPVPQIPGIDVPFIPPPPDGYSIGVWRMLR